MFLHSASSGEQIRDVDTLGSASVVIQPLRINPIQGGAWCIPAFHPDIPSVVKTEDTSTFDVWLSQLGLLAYADGVALPRGEFTTVKTAIENQWQSFFNKTSGKAQLVNLTLSIACDEDDYVASIGVNSYINYLAIKKLVEELNTACRGLGWWVTNVAQRVKSLSIPVYDIESWADKYGYMNHMDEFTDQSKADILNEMNLEPGEAERSIQEWKDESSDFWPSMLMEAAGQHGFLFNQTIWNDKNRTRDPLCKTPFTATSKAALRFTKCKSSPRHLVDAVQAFLTLEHELMRSDSGLKLAEPADRSDGIEPIGAAVAIVWNSTELAVDLLGHSEQYAMEGEGCTTDHLMLRVHHKDPENASKMKNFLTDLALLHGALGEAFKHFEVLT